MKKLRAKKSTRFMAMCMALSLAVPHTYYRVNKGAGGDNGSQIIANEDIVISNLTNMVEKRDLNGVSSVVLKPDNTMSNILFDDAKLDLALDIINATSVSESQPNLLYCESEDETYYAKSYSFGYILSYDGMLVNDVADDVLVKPISDLSNETLTNGVKIAIYVKPNLTIPVDPSATPTDATPTDASALDSGYSLCKTYLLTHSAINITDMVNFSNEDGPVSDNRAYNNVSLKLSRSLLDGTVGHLAYSYCLNKDFTENYLDSLDWKDDIGSIELNKDTAVEDEYIGVIGYFVDDNNDGIFNKLVAYSKTQPVKIDVTDPEFSTFVKKESSLDSDDVTLVGDTYYLGKKDINNACIFIMSSDEVSVKKITSEGETDCETFGDSDVSHVIIDGYGEVIYEITVKEESGNISTANISVFVDDEEPKINTENISVGEKLVKDNRVVSGSNALSFEVTDNTELPISCTVTIKDMYGFTNTDNAVYNEETGRYEVLLPNDVNKKYEISIDAKDYVGNDADTYTFEYVYDDSFPVINNVQVWYSTSDEPDNWMSLPEDRIIDGTYIYNKADGYNYSITASISEDNIQSVKIGENDFVKESDTDKNGEQIWRYVIPGSYFEESEYTPAFDEIIVTDESDLEAKKAVPVEFYICTPNIFIEEAVLIDKNNNAVSLYGLEGTKYTNQKLKIRATISSDCDLTNASLIYGDDKVYQSIDNIVFDIDEYSRRREATVEFVIFKNTNVNTILNNMYLYVEDADEKSDKSSVFELFLDKTRPTLVTTPEEAPNVWVAAPYSFDALIKPGEMADELESGIKEGSAYYTIDGNAPVNLDTSLNENNVSVVKTTVDVPTSKDIDGTCVKFFATDLADNTLADNSFIVKVDDDIPVIENIFARNGSSDTTKPLNGTITLGATVSDMFTIDKITYKLTKVGDDNVVKENEVSVNLERTSGDKIRGDVTLDKLSSLENGVYEVVITVYDKAGHYSSNDTPYKFTVDNSNPIVRDGSVDNFGKEIKIDEEWHKDYKLNFVIMPGQDYSDSDVLNEASYKTICDPSNMTEKSLKILTNGDNKGCSIGSVDVPESTLTTGTMVVFSATDNAGNSIAAPNAFTIKVDKTKPTIESFAIGGSNNVKIFNYIPEITLTAKDNLTLNEAVIEVIKPDNTVISKKFDISSEEVNGSKVIKYLIDEELDDGEYVVKVRAFDKAGNESKISALKFYYDKTEPIILNDDGTKLSSDDKWYNENPFVRNYVISSGDNEGQSNVVTADYIITGSVNNKNGSLLNAPASEFKASLEVPESNNVSGTKVSFTLHDESGNKGEDSVIYKIDTHNPVIENVLADEYDTYHSFKKAPMISADISDNLTINNVIIAVEYPNGEIKEKEVTFGEDGERKNIYTTVNYEIEEVDDEILDGDYKVKVVAYDKAGNKSSEKSLLFAIDQTMPRILNTDGSKLVSDGKWYNDENFIKEYLIDSGDKSGQSKLISVYYQIFDSVNDVNETIDLPLHATSINPSIDVPESLEVTGTRIKFTAFDDAYNCGEAEITYKLDKHSPVIEELKLDDFDSFYMFNTVPKVNVTVTDNLSLDKMDITVTYPNGEERTDSFDYQKEEKNLSVSETYEIKPIGETLEDGEYIISIKTVDLAGNEAVVRTSSFGLDRTLPRILNEDESEIISDNIWYSDDSFIKNYHIDSGNAANQSVLSKVEYKIEGSVSDLVNDMPLMQETVIKPQIDIPESADVYGTKLSFDVSDEAKNSASASVIYKLDKHDPVIDTLNVNGYDSFYLPISGVPIFDVKVSDNLSLKKATIEILKPDGSLSNTVSLLDNGVIESSGANIAQTYTLIDLLGTSSLMDGDYAARVYVEDLSGRSAYKEFWFELDNTLPVVNLAVKDGVTANKAPLPDGSDMYYRSDVTVGFACLEKNFNPDLVTIKDNGKFVNTSWDRMNNLNTTSAVISAPGKHTIEVTIKDKASNNSETRSISFIIDKSVPTLGISLNGAGYGDGNVDLSSDANISVNIIDDNSDESDINVHVTKTFPDQAPTLSGFARTGEHQFRYSEEAEYNIDFYAVDMAGNVGPVRTVKFRIDKTAPEISIGGASANGTYNSPMSISFNMTEAYWWDASGSISIYRKAGDGMEETLYKTMDFKPTGRVSSHSEGISESGIYRAEFNATDKLGHTATTSQTFVLDKNAPVVNLFGVENFDITENSIEFLAEILDEFYLSKNINITGTRKDITGNINNIDFEFNPTSNPTRISKVFDLDGIYDINVTAKDMGGNETSKSVHFTIDKTAPIIGDLGEIDGSIVNKITLDYNLDELVTDLTVCDTHMFLNGSEYDNTSDIEDGAYKLLVTAEDELGHYSEKSAEFILDTKAPTFIITGVEDGETKEEPYSISVSLQLDEDILKSVKLNDTELSISGNECSFEVNEAGVYTLEMLAYDEAGNEASKSISFKYGSTDSSIWIWVITVFAGVGLIAFVGIKKSKKKLEDK